MSHQVLRHSLCMLVELRLVNFTGRILYYKKGLLMHKSYIELTVRAIEK